MSLARVPTAAESDHSPADLVRARPRRALRRRPPRPDGGGGGGGDIEIYDQVIESGCAVTSWQIANGMG